MEIGARDSCVHHANGMMFFLHRFAKNAVKTSTVKSGNTLSLGQNTRAFLGIHLAQAMRLFGNGILGRRKTMSTALIDRIGLKLLEQPLTVEDITNLVNYGSAGYTRGEIRVELNHILASQMVTAKVINNKDTYSLTRIGRRWAEGYKELGEGR